MVEKGITVKWREGYEESWAREWKWPSKAAKEKCQIGFLEAILLNASKHSSRGSSYYHLSLSTRATPNEKLKLVSAFGTWAPARCCHVAIYPIFIFIQLFLIYKFNNMNMIWWMRIRLVGKVFLFFSFLFNNILMKANNSYMAVMVP